MMIEKKKVYMEQIKNMIIFTYLFNKCHNIVIKYLFLVLINYNFIFYYFILIYKKLILH